MSLISFLLIDRVFGKSKERKLKKPPPNELARSEGSNQRNMNGSEIYNRQGRIRRQRIASDNLKVMDEEEITISERPPPEISGERESDQTAVPAELIDGSGFWYHQLLETDTWTRLAIGYNCNKEDILRLNGFVSDDIDIIRMERPVILIPKSNCSIDETLRNINYDEIEKDYKIRKFVMAKEVKKEVSEYYLSENDYHYESASRNYDDDVEWEKEYKKRNKLNVAQLK